MSATCTIGGVVFGALKSSASGRYCINAIFPGSQYKLIRFHPPGGDGNFVIRAGRVGAVINIRVMYFGTPEEVQGWYGDDKAAWKNSAVTITDELNLVSDTWNMLSMVPERPIGNGTKIILYVNLSFMWDG